MNTNLMIEPQVGQILVNVEDMSKFQDIRRAITMLKGVGQVTVPRRKRCSAYELSLRDLDEGRVTDHASVDDYFKKMGL